MPASKAPAKKPAPKAAPKAKAPAKPAASAPKAAAKPGAKPAPGKPLKPLAKAPAAKPTGLSAMAPVGAAAGAAADAEPVPKLEKLAEGTLCQIEILKDGHFFIARTQTESGLAKEYKNTVFEDLLTEMLITLQEQLTD